MLRSNASDQNNVIVNIKGGISKIRLG